MTYDLPLDVISAARDRIAPYIRHTPVAPTPHLTPDLPADFRLKLENLQVSGSFKARGVFNSLLLEPLEHCKRGVVTASGGNHGLALAYAAHRLDLPARVYLPENATADRVDRVQSWGAECVRFGSAYDDAHREAVRYASAEGLIYVEAFDSEATVAGQATLGLELLDDVPEMDAVFIAVGGGGLIAGMAAAIKQRKPSVTVIGIEPVGAASMQAGFTAGAPTELATVRTIADTLAAKRTGNIPLALAQQYVDELFTVSDADMIEGMQWLWRHYNQLVEPAAAASIAAIRTGKIDLARWQHPVALICGGNAAAEGIWHYYQDMARARGTL